MNIICVKCEKINIKPPYKVCFGCNNKIKLEKKKCGSDDCNNLIDKTYKNCYNCNNNKKNNINKDMFN